MADVRSCLDIPNFGNAASNLGCLLVGGLGLLTVLGPQGRKVFPDRADSAPYVIFFLGIALVSLGSAYYHARPDNARLFWDRLPMTIAFMAFFSAFVADRIHRRAGNGWLLVVLVLMGLGSLFYWDWTEFQGRGDLRFYGLVQFYPIVVLPVICWLFPRSQLTGGGYLTWIIAWYSGVKVLEYFDGEIFDLLGRTISGHSLKHLASAVAVFMAWRMLVANRRVEQQISPVAGLEKAR